MPYMVKKRPPTLKLRWVREKKKDIRLRKIGQENE